MRRVVAVLATVIGLLVGVTGCVAIPTSGGLSRHVLRGTDDPLDVNFVASGPQHDDSQEETLRGFIRAGIETRNGYATAREFLTSNLAGKWNPAASVLISDGGSGSVARTGAQSATLGVEASAKLDASGLYTPASGTTTLSYSFLKVRGQWRISSAPDGTVLSPYNFRLLFSPYPLYFLDPSRTYLVPDLRWFLRSEGASDRIVRALLAGPAPWLSSGVVLSAFPKGTQIGTDGVIIDGGTATVDLSSDVLSEDTAARRRMVAQLQASLQAVGTIASVKLTARAFPVDVGSAGEGSSPVLDPQVSSTPFALSTTAFGTVGTSGLRPFDPFSSRVVALSPRAVTIDRDQSAVVVLGAAGTSRIGLSGEPTLVDRRSGQVAPSIDPEGYAWTALASGSDSFQVTDEKGQTHAVSTAGAADGALTAFRISRDGTRVAMAVSTADGPRLEVAAIQRDAALAPTALGSPLVIPVDASSILDLAWSDDVTLAVLAQQDDAPVVQTQQVGGQETDLGVTEGGVQIVGGNDGTDGLRVLTSSGALQEQSGAGGWQATGGGGLRLLAVQQ